MKPFEWSYCARTKQLKPPRAHYCHTTKRLVLNLDHYCVWVFNSVGYRNHRYFVRPPLTAQHCHHTPLPSPATA